MAPLVRRWHGRGQRWEVSLRMSDSRKWVAREGSYLWKGAGTQVSSRTRKPEGRGPIDATPYLPSGDTRMPARVSR